MMRRHWKCIEAPDDSSGQPSLKVSLADDLLRATSRRRVADKACLWASLGGRSSDPPS
jgi:hypothetical protein